MNALRGRKRPAARLWLAGLGAALGIQLLGTHALAESPDELFRMGANALSEGKFEDAIDEFEAFADQGKPQPDASYNRGLAYLLRVRSGAAKPGDLGRAAAAFEEALSLRPDD